ncbi:phospholipase D family protein [Tropicimonas sediminicola]|uniref:Phospholipase D n=1 Tax=Tropicimonas sediminicola TaxID=1031541 RepID=A0A239LXM4_9RHOB|nr:phospholipase D-like domain-containing protein [Tropicimonas sediminicola]SNT35417.1 phospholipase D1/2 [Tropicimonas sediminicola]
MSTEPDDQSAPVGDMRDLRVLITAEEAYPAYERAFLDAKYEIWACFRVFDPDTTLRSEEGKAIGETWFDLLVHVLKRGVAIHFVLSDFDPILARKLHRVSWEARRSFEQAARAAGPMARLRIVNALHPARVGLLPRLLLWPLLIKELRRAARDLNAQPAEERARQLSDSPGLRKWLKEETGGRLSARKWPPPPLVPGTHHQKIAVFDRELLCIGGLDLDERRYDDKNHQRRRDETWHDVQVMCRGPIVAEAQRHLESFRQVVEGQAEAPPTGRLLRTLSRRRDFPLPFLGPRPLVGELAQAHLEAFRAARRLIYLETQFLRDRRVADALAEAAQAQPDLGLILVLPGAPEDVAFEAASGPDARYGEYLQARCIRRVEAAFGPRAAICSPVRPEKSPARGRDTLCGAPIIYVHAKVACIDDERALVSSANLNGRSLWWDTEAGVALDDPRDVRHLRQRVMRHWLPKDAGDDLFDLDSAAGTWRGLAQANAAKAPEARAGFLVPYDPRPAEEFGYPLPGVPDAMV